VGRGEGEREGEKERERESLPVISRAAAECAREPRYTRARTRQPNPD
jgi:hypothetical protein